MKKILPVLVVVLFIMTGCSTDYHYARSFISKFERNKSDATEQIYVCLPTSLIHTNSSLDEIAYLPYMPESWQDSVIASKTSILNRINDSIFISQFSNAFLFTLSRLRVPIVLVDNPADLPVADDNHFIVNFVQLEAEEFLQPSRSGFQTKKGVYYSYDYDLRHFATHVWMKLDAVDTSSSVYYKNDEIADSFRGTVTSIKGDKATLKTDFERINTNDAYRVARRLGSSCAILYAEKILVEYVCRKKGTNGSYFYYNPGYNAIDAVLPYDEGIKDSFEKL